MNYINGAILSSIFMFFVMNLIFYTNKSGSQTINFDHENNWFSFLLTVNYNDSTLVNIFIGGSMLTLFMICKSFIKIYEVVRLSVMTIISLWFLLRVDVNIKMIISI